MTEGLFSSLYGTGQPFALIDARERREHVDGHWFGSTHVPLSDLTARITRMVPDRSFPLHLLDWQDAASTATMRRLLALGYSNVTACPTRRPDRFGNGFVQGEFVWSKAFGEVVAHLAGLPEVTPADYLRDHRDALLFDVRPTAEYAQFTLPGSYSLPNSLMLANMTALKETKQMALLHCAGRTRSIIGACTLKAAGYDGPFAVFRGGTQAWQLEGHQREHGANRCFASDTGSTEAAEAFLEKWNIPFKTIDHQGLAAAIGSHGKAHLFDVSDDAATGQRVGPGILRISGTNLIQQTDRWIARYHVPVVLFDYGSGSRAAFAAFWLRAMGFLVQVLFLTGQLEEASTDQEPAAGGSAPFRPFSADQLLLHRDANHMILDFRPSKAFGETHLKGSHWCNIGALLIGEQTLPPASDPVAIVGTSFEHGCEMAEHLAEQGWQVAGVHGWNGHTLDPEHLAFGAVRSPIDESALFAGRHHGNLQDSRDYLAWEEALPDQIDAQIHTLWQRLLGPLKDE